MFPIVASVSPETLATATAAPTVIPPTAIPIAHGRTVRVADASTSTMLAFSIAAPVSMCAFWLLASLRTTTWAPTATRPPWPAKAIAFELSVEEAVTLTAPFALTSALPPTDASACARRLATSTEPPTATMPPEIDPTIPKNSRLSRAMMLMLPPATIVPLTEATVPSIGPARSAACVLPLGALAAIFWPTPSPVPPVPIWPEMRPSALPLPLLCWPLRIFW